MKLAMLVAVPGKLAVWLCGCVADDKSQLRLSYPPSSDRPIACIVVMVHQMA
jgi:hypothetical protein